MTAGLNNRRIGVLALQGDFREHREALERLGADVSEVRKPEDLDAVDALVIPGGESTVISKLLDSSGLRPAIESRLAGDDLAVMGTCAGMIVSAQTVEGAVAGQRSLGAFQAEVVRNAIGPQKASCEVDIAVEGLIEPFRAIFIRPPAVASVGPGVEVLAEWQGSPVLCRQGRHLFATFHPELASDDRIHELFLERV